MKNQKGVTMIELVIVLVILLLMTTFAVYTGSESTNQAIATEVYTEINSMKSATNSILIKKELNEDFILEEGIHFDKKLSDEITIDELKENYGINIDTPSEFQKLYLIYGMDEYGMSGDRYKSSNVGKNYGLDSIKHTYLVNFETGKVDLLNSLTIANKQVRTYEQIRALVDDGDI